MKKLLFVILVLLLVVSNNVLAAGDSYYVNLTAEATPTGAGTVYAGYNTSTAGTFGETSTSESGEVSENTQCNFYVHAKANTGYNFLGWSESTTGTILSTDNPYQVSYTASGKITKTIFARFAEKSTITITFESSTNGTYTATDGTNTVTNSGTMSTEESVTLTATPDSGYKVYGWYTKSGSTKEYFSFDAQTTKTFTSAATVGVDFIPTDTPVFLIKGSTETYTDLNDAIDAVGSTSSVIVLFKDGTLPAGDYTIPTKTTLLIPYDAAYTVETTEPTRVSSYSKISAYKTLKLAEGANITVNGAICVGGQMLNSGTLIGTSSGSPGAVSGAYGCIDMSEGGHIQLNSGAKLYAWGYIVGQNKDQGNNTSGVGTIDALSGSTVYENFVMGNWRGGTATSNMAGNSRMVFPINQYFLPNVEVPLTIYAGATENVVTSVTMTLIGEVVVPVTFIASSGGFFKLNSGASLTKWYDATTDYLCVETSGNCEVSSITISVSSTSLNSDDYVLPLTHNLDITVKDGTLTLPYDIAILPGARIKVAEGATGLVSANLFVYDLDEWGYYVYSNSYYYVSYELRPTSHYSRTGWGTTAKLADAQLTVDGTLNISGSMYSTASGANICSTGKGSITFTNAPTATTSTYQATMSGSTISYTAISCVAPWLMNADGTYVKTAGTSAGSSYYYYNGKWNTSATPYEAGDVNHSGDVTISDVPSLLKVLLGQDSADEYGTSNVNNDAEVNLDDLDALIGIIKAKN